MVSKLEAGIDESQAELDKARAAGDEKRVKDLEAEVESKRAFLDMARRASEEFGG